MKKKGKKTELSHGGFPIIRISYHHEWRRNGKLYRIYTPLMNQKYHGLGINSQAATDCFEKAAGYCQLIRIDNEHPEKLCYACSTESRFPSCLAARRKMEPVWRDLNPDEITDAYLYILTRGSRLERFVNPQGYVKVRFLESGGIWSQELLEKFERCAEIFHFFGKSVGIPFLSQTFTSNPTLDINPLKYLVLKKSGISGPCYHGRFVTFTDNEEIPANYLKCREDCRICSFCHIKGKNIYTLLHSGQITLQKMRQVA